MAKDFLQNVISEFVFTVPKNFIDYHRDDQTHIPTSSYSDTPQSQTFQITHRTSNINSHTSRLTHYLNQIIPQYMLQIYQQNHISQYTFQAYTQIVIFFHSHKHPYTIHHSLDSSDRILNIHTFLQPSFIYSFTVSKTLIIRDLSKRLVGVLIRNSPDNQLPQLPTLDSDI
ncbi:hypothetical protein V6Z12_D01G259800 [Gossypium hirsutum]